ncbi:hypothetical protein ACFLZP_02310 [Patescibacteria group bacterium]
MKPKENSFSFLKKTLSIPAKMALSLYSLYLSISFVIISIFEATNRKVTFLLIYFTAFILLVVNFFLYRPSSGRFKKEGAGNWLFKTSAALAIPITIFNFLYPEKLVLLHKLNTVIDRAIYHLFVQALLLAILIYLCPPLLSFLLSYLVPGYRQKRVLLTSITYLLFVILLVADLQNQNSFFLSLPSLILDHQLTTKIIKYLLGIPLFFWIKSLFPNESKRKDLL